MTTAPHRFTYGSDPLRYADLHLPNAAPSGVVVLIHGGFWRAGVGTHGLVPMAKSLTALGYAAWEVEYRAVGSGGGCPATLQDVAAAIDRMPDALRETGLRDRGLGEAGLHDLPTAVVGHSAGGQLAVWSAIRAARGRGSVRLQGAVSLGGVLDMTGGAAEHVGGGAVQAFLGGDSRSIPDAYRDADPTLLAADGGAGTRVRSVHGNADHIVPVAHSRRFTDAARAAGWDARLDVVDADHFAVVEPDSAVWPVVLRAIREILAPID